MAATPTAGDLLDGIFAELDHINQQLAPYDEEANRINFTPTGRFRMRLNEKQSRRLTRRKEHMDDYTQHTHYAAGNLIAVVSHLRKHGTPDEIIDVIIRAQDEIVAMEKPTLRRATDTDTALRQLDEIGGLEVQRLHRDIKNFEKEN